MALLEVTTLVPGVDGSVGSGAGGGHGAGADACAGVFRRAQISLLIYLIWDHELFSAGLDSRCRTHPWLDIAELHG